MAFNYASGAEEAILNWSGRISRHFWMYGKMKLPIDTQANQLYCVKYNQHAKHASARVSGGMHLGKVWKTGTHRLNLGAFQDWTIAVSHFNWKLISDMHD